MLFIIKNNHKMNTKKGNFEQYKNHTISSNLR